MAAAEPMIKQDPTTKAVQLFEVRIDPKVAQARDLEIADQAGYERAADFLRDSKTLQQEIHNELDPAVAAAHEAHKKMTAVRAKLLDPLVSAERIVKTKMGAYVAKKEEEEKAERLRQEREARRAEEDRRIREAAELEARGEAKAADEVLEAPIVTPVLPAAPKPTATGTSTRWKYSARVVDLPELIRAVAEGKAPAGVVIADESALNKLAGALKESLAIPGVELVREPVIAAQARR